MCNKLTSVDYERIQQTLDSLNDNPTEEEAEAILQAHSTSGKEVVNGFIDHLLKENLRAREKIAQEVERMYGPHDRRFKTAMEIADKLRMGEPETRCPRCGETAANHGDYTSGEDWVCPTPHPQLREG